MINKNKIISVIVLLIITVSTIFLSGCVEEKSREDAIPDDAIKYTPEMDLFLPIIG